MPRVIRVANKKDLDAVVAVEATAQSHPWTFEQFDQEIGCPWSTFWVAMDHGGALIGYTIFWETDVLQLLNIAVVKSVQRSGHGLALMEGLLERANLVSKHVFLEVRASNAPAIEFYTRCGFHKIEIRNNYYSGPIEDAWVMRWTQ